MGSPFRRFSFSIGNWYRTINLHQWSIWQTPTNLLTVVWLSPSCVDGLLWDEYWQVAPSYCVVHWYLTRHGPLDHLQLGDVHWKLIYKGLPPKREGNSPAHFIDDGCGDFSTDSLVIVISCNDKSCLMCVDTMTPVRVSGPALAHVTFRTQVVRIVLGRHSSYGRRSEVAFSSSGASSLVQWGWVFFLSS